MESWFHSQQKEETSAGPTHERAGHHAQQRETSDNHLIEKLTILNRISETLNQAVDVRGVLDDVLADLVDLMGLETGWITLKDPLDAADPADWQHVLAAHHHLPPALAPDNDQAWSGRCTCQDLFKEGRLTEAYNEIECSRLARGSGDCRGLTVHASAPLRSADRTLGILNVAAADWPSFDTETLALLTNVGSQMGAALERARLYDLLQERHVHQQATLLHSSNQLLGHLDLDYLMPYLVEEVRAILSADACALLLPGGAPGFLEFRAATGWRHDPVTYRRKVPLDANNGPAQVMSTRRPLIVPDLQVDDPTSWTPEWLRDEGFRGHAVVPLVVEDHAVGALVLNQRQPRLVREEDLHLLHLIANQAAIALEKARLRETEARMHDLERELAIGRQIQLSLLPSRAPVVQGWEFTTFYAAAKEVGGDFYDFFELPGQPGKLGMIIADVTGKGVPAALFMARTSTILRSTSLRVGSPANALRTANTLILADGQTELLLTAFYAVLDTHTGQLWYANAGHDRPLWLQSPTGAVRTLASLSMILGAVEDMDVEEREIEVQPGDILIFYTDGVSEAMDANQQPFGLERLGRVIAANRGASSHQMLDAIVGAVREFTGGIPQSDDLTLLAVRRLPTNPEAEESPHHVDITKAADGGPHTTR
jgi:sigma-B regulation protein RsbU (phosphoserine phosphatase)